MLEKTEFFMPMIPPTITHQEKDFKIARNKKGKLVPRIYEPKELGTARIKLQDNLGKHVPAEKYTGPVRLITKWCFPITGKHRNGEYKTTRPDVTNLQKMFEDVMTKLGYWTDDALIVSAITEKFWSDKPGIYVKIEPLE